MSQPSIVAHRGDLEDHPENTLAAFERAIVKGADIIEMDVFLTRDGELAVHHDYTLGRTTDGAGYLGDFTLAELKQLDAGYWFGPDFEGERTVRCSNLAGGVCASSWKCVPLHAAF